MLRHVALVRTNVSEELKEPLSSSETSVLTIATRRNVPEDPILLMRTVPNCSRTALPNARLYFSVHGLNPGPLGSDCYSLTAPLGVPPSPTPVMRLIPPSGDSVTLYNSLPCTTRCSLSRPSLDVSLVPGSHPGRLLAVLRQHPTLLSALSRLVSLSQ
jgi:hypothetical protein